MHKSSLRKRLRVNSYGSSRSEKYLSELLIGAQEILDVSKYTKSFDIDDVYISGILRLKLGLPLFHFKAVYVPELWSDFTFF